MIDTPIQYLLRAVHYHTEDDIIERQIFERRISLNVLDKISAVRYDPNLKMHFEDESNSGFLVALNVDDFQLLLCKRMKQAEDILRRVNYLFDKVIAKVRADGKVLSLENFDEIKSNWEQLKLYLLGDYSGDEMEDYIEEINEWFQSKKTIGQHIFHYFHFGLLFPGIPAKHPGEWNRKRLVGLSEYEWEPFEESIQFVSKDEIIRQYRLIWAMPENSTIDLLKCEGTMKLKENCICPCHVHAAIEFQLGEGNNRWIFDLEQQQDEDTDEEEKQVSTAEYKSLILD